METQDRCSDQRGHEDSRQELTHQPRSPSANNETSPSRQPTPKLPKASRSVARGLTHQTLLIRDGKGAKDRRTVLPAALEKPQDWRGGAASPPRDHSAAGGQSGRRQSRDRQTCRLPHVAAFVCNSSAGGWLRHPDYTGIVGTHEREHNDDLYACAQQGRSRCSTAP